MALVVLFESRRSAKAGFIRHLIPSCHRILDIYGRKVLGQRLRKGTAIDLHLNDNYEGVFNIEGFAGRSEMILCGSLFDALTFWVHGYRNVTCTFADAISTDLQTAFNEFNIRRVLVTNEKLVEPLLSLGLEVFTVQLPLGITANAYAGQTHDPADALGTSATTM